MTKALAALPWVEFRTIEADRATHTVKFGINDRKSYSADALREVLPKRYREGLNVLHGPG